MACSSGDEFSAGNLHPKSEIFPNNAEEISGYFSDHVIYTTAKDDGQFGPIDAKPKKWNNSNKKSAASSKERRKRYISALERAVQSLRTTSTSLTSQLSQLKEDTNGLSSNNTELKLRMQSMENDVDTQDARNKALRKEIQELREMFRQSIQNEAPAMNFPSKKFQVQNLQLNQFQRPKQDGWDFDTRSALPSPSGTDIFYSALPSPSYTEYSSNDDTTTVSYNDYRLF